MPVSRVRQALQRSWRQFCLALRKVMALEDSPDRIARGCAAGMFFAYPPMLGQTLGGMALAWLLRGNVLAAIPWSWISNPLTTLPIWYGCYLLGTSILPGYEVLTWERLKDIFTELDNLSIRDALSHGLSTAGDVLLPTVLGSTIVGILSALPTYWLVLRGVQAIQRHRAHRADAWRQHTARQPKAAAAADGPAPGSPAPDKHTPAA
jgi:hypothetical protein